MFVPIWRTSNCYGPLKSVVPKRFWTIPHLGISKILTPPSWYLNFFIQNFTYTRRKLRWLLAWSVFSRPLDIFYIKGKCCVKNTFYKMCDVPVILSCIFLLFKRIWMWPHSHKNVFFFKIKALKYSQPKSDILKLNNYSKLRGGNLKSWKTLRVEGSGWNLVGKISTSHRYMIDITGMDPLSLG